MKATSWPSDLGPVLCIVGARPNFMKMAPILRAFAEHQPPIPTVLVHTGQHYDKDMSDKLFEDLCLPRPGINLEVGSGSHAVQTAEVMKRFEPLLDDFRPSAVLVVGDVNSTLACSLVAVKRGVPTVHVEAGLRSFDRAMPEEINRILTDQIADRLYTTERDAAPNLEREGIPAERIRFVGNVMIDSLLFHREKAKRPQDILAAAGVNPEILTGARGYGLVTLHRPSNVDSPEPLGPLLTTLRTISDSIPLIFALHPRTRANIERFGLGGVVATPRMILLPPQGYLEMIGLMASSLVVITDSGGLQEETTALGVPCLTVRENTERPITIDEGTNTLVGCDPAAILAATESVLSTGGKRGRVPEFWDGQAARRIAEDLARWLLDRAAAAQEAR